MIRNGWRNHLPLVRTLLLLVALLLLVGLGLSLLLRGTDQDRLDPADWQWAPAASFDESAPPAAGWIPYSSEPDLHNRNRYYWLRIPLHDRHMRDPQLQLFKFVALRVFNGYTPIFDYDPGTHSHRVNLLLHWNQASLSSPVPPEVYVLTDSRGAARPAPEIRMIGKSDLYISLFRKDVFNFILAALFLFTSLTSLSLYASRRDKLQLYLAVLSFCSFYDSLVRNDLLLVYWHQPWLGYMDLAVFPLGVYAFVGIMSEIFSSSGSRILQAFRRILLGYAVLILAASVLLPPRLYNILLGFPLMLLFLVTVGVVFYMLHTAYLKRQGPDSVWMLAGSIIAVLCVLVHVTKAYFPSFYSDVVHADLLFSRFPFDPLSAGLFMFLICLIRVILYRFGAMNERLQHIGDFLEENVRARTAELDAQTSRLKNASDRLAETTRETAETIAASMVLEERNRLTGQIHDTVGHALTATIIQLEASRRLLSRDPRLALDKLTASQELIRKGLDEIRQSARILRDDFTRYDLADAMIGLIEETQASTEAQIRWQIDPLPDTLSILQKRLLYHALQEGMTNGLRHGGSTRFRFSLTVNFPVLLFRLESDGRTYTPGSLGFGLKAMSEQVGQLGGVMSIEPGHPGCVLLLTLPCREPPYPLQRQEATG